MFVQFRLVSGLLEKKIKGYVMPHLMQFKWQHVRHVVLTVDPKKFSPQEAFDFVQEHKCIPAMIRNLSRTKDINVTDWRWFLEFHKDGRPHWHLLLQMEKRGRGQV